MSGNPITAALDAVRYASATLRRTAGEISPEDAAGLHDPSRAIHIDPDEPHTDWQQRFRGSNMVKWHPPFGETHVKYHVYQVGGGKNPTLWRANHHGTYQGMHTLSPPSGSGADITFPNYSHSDFPDPVGGKSFRRIEDAKAAAEAHFAENYGNPKSVGDYDLDQVMDSHPAAGRRGLGDDEDYGHIFGMLRRAGWEMADIVRLAGDGMSWEDTMAHIDSVLAEGEGPDHSDYGSDYSVNDPDNANGSFQCDHCGRDTDDAFQVDHVSVGDDYKGKFCDGCLQHLVPSWYENNTH